MRARREKGHDGWQTGARKEKNKNRNATIYLALAGSQIK